VAVVAGFDMGKLLTGVVPEAVDGDVGEARSGWPRRVEWLRDPLFSSLLESMVACLLAFVRPREQGHCFYEEMKGMDWILIS
jgi:hypothetical protein